MGGVESCVGGGAGVAAQARLFVGQRRVFGVGMRRLASPRRINAREKACRCHGRGTIGLSV